MFWRFTDQTKHTKHVSIFTILILYKANCIFLVGLVMCVVLERILQTQLNVLIFQVNFRKNAILHEHDNFCFLLTGTSSCVGSNRYCRAELFFGRAMKNDVIVLLVAISSPALCWHIFKCALCFLCSFHLPTPNGSLDFICQYLSFRWRLEKFSIIVKHVPQVIHKPTSTSISLMW